MKKEPLTLVHFKQWLPVRPQNSYKGDYGRALLIGGNRQMGGAVQMNAQAAVYAGCGLVTVASDKANLPAVHASLPETMFIDWDDTEALEHAIHQSEIIAIGSGMTQSEQCYFDILMDTLSEAMRLQTLIIDAGAIQMYGEVIKKRPDLFIDRQLNIVLTPHLGEWRQLTEGSVDSRDPKAIQRFVDQSHAIVALKGAPTRIFAPDKGTYYENIYGNPGQAIGGMGDTLVGVIVAMVGVIDEPFHAVAAGVLLHSYTADRIYDSQAIVVPTRLARELPRALKQIIK